MFTRISSERKKKRMEWHSRLSQLPVVQAFLSFLEQTRAARVCGLPCRSPKSLATRPSVIPAGLRGLTTNAAAPHRVVFKQAAGHQV